MEDRGLIAMFARHPVAGNLLMWILILFGIWGASTISRQVLPNFTIEKIRVTVQWPGASPEDIESNVLDAIEPEIRFLEKVNRVDSVAAEGRAEIDRFEIVASSLCGVHLAAAGQLTLSHGVVRESPIGACFDVPIDDILSTFTEVAFVDNGRNLSSETLPVPDPSSR